jgi:hypothetical protein
VSTKFPISVGCSWVTVFRVLSGCWYSATVTPSNSVLSRQSHKLYNIVGLVFSLHFCLCAVHPYRSPNPQFNCSDTNVILNVFAIQSYLPFSAPIRRHDTSLRLSMPLRTNLVCGNLVFALFTRAYTSPITESRFAVRLIISTNMNYNSIRAP